jgi:hypothetical protein
MLIFMCITYKVPNVNPYDFAKTLFKDLTRLSLLKIIDAISVYKANNTNQRLARNNLITTKSQTPPDDSPVFLPPFHSSPSV